MGMGDAYTAIAENQDALEYNPAGLAFNKNCLLDLSGNWFEYDYITDFQGIRDSINSTIGDGKIAFAGRNIGLSLEYRIEGDIKNSDNYGFFITKYLQVVTGYGINFGNLSIGICLRLINIVQSQRL